MQRANGTDITAQNNPKEKFIIATQINAVPNSNMAIMLSAFIASSTCRNGTNIGIKISPMQQPRREEKIISPAWQAFFSQNDVKY